MKPTSSAAKPLRPLVTAAQVVAALPRIRSEGAPEAMVEALVEYINDELPFHSTASLRRSYRKRFPLIDDFWRALGAMERAGQPLLESFKWQREKLSEALPRYGLSPTTPDINDRIEQIETVLHLVRKLRATTFSPSYGKRRERWHDVANALAPLVTKIYLTGERTTIDLRTSTAAGVAAIRWALGWLGYSVTDDAIAQHFKRARKARTIPPA
jgi:hypothetical protein